MNTEARRGSRRARLLSALVATTLLVGSIGTGSVAAADADFGSVPVGQSASQSQTIPLTYALSDLPGGTVVYDGGNSLINLSLGSLGLTAPVTASELLSTIGDVVAHYHLFLSSSNADFSTDSAACLSGTGSCVAEVTFHPTAEGPRTATIFAHIQDVQTVGGGSFSSLISLLAPFLAASVEGQLSVAVSGVGLAEGSAGGVVLNVAVEPEPEPCILIDVTSLDFGTLPFSTEGTVSTASRGLSATSCSTGDETIYASGTDAAGDGEPAGAWALTDATICDATPNLYGVGLNGVVGTQDPQQIRVITDQRAFVDLQPEDSAATDVAYLMPCQGSTGAGQTMTSTVTFTAVIE